MVALIVFGTLSVLFVTIIVPRWLMFDKAGQMPWASLIPFWSSFVEMRITGRPEWWGWLLLVFPAWHVPLLIISQFDLARAFGRSWAFGLGMLLFPIIFYPILAYGRSRYVGPGGSGICVSAEFDPFAPRFGDD